MSDLLASRSRLGPRLFGFPKGLIEFECLAFILLLEGLALVGGVLELFLYYRYLVLDLAPGGLFGLQICSRLISGRIAHPGLLLGPGKFTREGLDLGSAICNYAHNSV